MLTKKLIVIILILSVSIGYTQNLGPNPSFENLLICPDNINYGSVDICLMSWADPTNGSSDCFNVCSSLQNFSIPDNLDWYGYQYPRTGNGYAGFIAYQGPSFYREYIHNQLTDSLKQDSCYYMEFYVNKTNYVRYAVNLGCYISV